MSDDFSNEKEIEIIRSIVNKDSSITIDLGANVGIFTKVLAEHSKHVYAFEPEPYNFSQLKENMKSYNNVTLYNMAASNITGSDAILHKSVINNGMHRLYESKLCWGEKVRVKTVRLDDLPELQNVKINFIKMDIEGFEYFALLGMTNIIKRDKPVIISEFHPDSIRESGASPERIFDLMTKEFDYLYPIHCITREMFDAYEGLEKVTNDPKGGVNILWICI
jgi:FkbM family methyltransferase